MIEVRVTLEPFDVAEIADRLARTGGGGISSFTGVVRGTDGSGPALTALELEHYPGMTEAVLTKLAEEATARWNLAALWLHHRVGRLEVGEPIVHIATAAAHRAEAIDACTFLIDRLKTDAPFWKKEHFGDGTSRWVDARQSDDNRADAWSRS